MERKQPSLESHTDAQDRGPAPHLQLLVFPCPFCSPRAPSLSSPDPDAYSAG